MLAIIFALVAGSASSAPWALLRTYAAQRNPAWAAGRWRGSEHPDATFSQWWYLMVTDLDTNETWSLGIGGFRSGRRGAPGTAGGWVKVKRAGEGAATALPRFTVPFSLLEADEELGVRVWRDGADVRNPDAAALRIDVLDESTLRIRAALGSPLEGGGYSSGADVVLTRIHGVIGSDPAAKEECRIANVPFSYAASISGHFWIGAGDGNTGSLADAGAQLGATGGSSGGSASVTMSAADGPRFRAYLETTWGCTFPSPLEGADPLLYPWKWMWAVVPGEAAAAGASGAEDVGVLVNHARLAVPLVPGVISSMDVQVRTGGEEPGVAALVLRNPTALPCTRAHLRSSTFPAVCASQPLM